MESTVRRLLGLLYFTCPIFNNNKTIFISIYTDINIL